jgi:hypothetical protein
MRNEKRRISKAACKATLERSDGRRQKASAHSVVGLQDPIFRSDANFRSAITSNLKKRAVAFQALVNRAKAAFADFRSSRYPAAERPRGNYLAPSKDLTASLRTVIAKWLAALPMVITLFATAGSSGDAVQTAARTNEEKYEIVSKGLLGSLIVPFQFKSANLRVEIRNLVMGTGSAKTPPAPTRTILEVRGGTLTTILDGQKKTYLPGDFFVIEKGTVLEMQNPGDVTVIRALCVFEGQK